MMPEPRADVRSESDRRLQEFIDHMPAMVYMKDLDGHLVLHNRKADELWGLSQDEIADQRAHAGVARDAGGAATTTPASRPARPRTRSSRPMVLADGKHWYSSIKFPVFDAAGEVYGIGAITRDITDRRRVDEELSEAYRQLEKRALHDSLTGLPNRTQLLERLAAARSAPAARDGVALRRPR